MPLFPVVRRAGAVLGDEPRWPWVGLVGLSVGVAFLEAIGAVLVLTLVRVIVAPEESVRLPVIGDLAVYWGVTDPSIVRLRISIAVVVFFVLRSVIVALQAFLRARTVELAAARLSDHLLRGYLAFPWLTHTSINSSTLVRNAYVATQQFGGQVLRPLVAIAAELVVVVVLSGVLLVLAPGATLLAVAVFGVTVLVLLRVIQPLLRRLGRDAQDARSSGLQAITQALAGIRDIRLHEKAGFFATRYEMQRHRVARAEYLRSTASEVPRTLIETTLVVVIVLLLALSQGNEGLAASAGIIPTLGVFAYVGLRLQPSLTKIVDSLNQLKFGAAILDDLHADRALADQAIADRARAGLAVGPDLAESIEVRAGRFTYPGADRPALDGIDLKIPRGAFIGICGPTGGGKSTLLDVLVGLLPLDAGELLVDGVAVVDGPPWWHRQLGVVSQAIFLTDDTIAANVAFGVPPEEVDHDRLGDAVTRAQLNEVIAGLPDGLATMVGERGLRLSGGQRQRVAIARALYGDPAVIILDEGTSALDAGTEASLVAALGELREDRTLVAVAHRTATVMDADEIHVVDAGRIVASGTYAQLLDGNNVFRRLVSGS